MLIVADDGGQHFQSSGITSKYSDLCQNSQKIRKKMRKKYEWFIGSISCLKRMVLIVGHNVGTLISLQCPIPNMGRSAVLDEK